MKGSQYIAKFLKAVGANKVFQVQGGAISFMVDAITLEEGMEFYKSSDTCEWIEQKQEAFMNRDQRKTINAFNFTKRRRA
jgi:hypothetical protein